MCQKLSNRHQMPYASTRSLTPYQRMLLENHLSSTVAVKRSTIPLAGKGVFALRDLPKNFFIPYTGKRFESWEEYEETGNDSTYSMEVCEGGMIIDGHPRYNRSRYSVAHRINEPPQGEKANVSIDFQKGWAKKVSPIGFRTTRPIQKGEELWGDYGEDYERDY